jgi:hypothetical protein
VNLLRAVLCAALIGACGAVAADAPKATTSSADCGSYAPPPMDVDATIQHLKTSASVIEVTSPCTVRVRISGGINALAAFTDKVIVLRAMQRTTFKSAPEGDLGAIGRFGLKQGDVFTLSFDSRAFPDGTYPLNFMNW